MGCELYISNTLSYKLFHLAPHEHILTFTMSRIDGYKHFSGANSHVSQSGKASEA